MKKLLWTSALALTAMACLTACDESGTDSGLSIAEYKTASALPDTCSMEVAKVDTTYFACQENKWIEVTDSATVEKIKEGIEESDLQEVLEEMAEVLPTPDKKKSSSSSKKVESSDDKGSVEPESSASEDAECTGRRCGSSSSKKKDSESGSGSGGGSGTGEGGSGSGEGGSTPKCPKFDDTQAFCVNGVIYPLCGDAKESYNVEEKYCKENGLNGVIDDLPLCGTTKYNPDMLSCCGTQTYKVSEKFCLDDKDLRDRCSGMKYDPTRHECVADRILGKCGTKTYDFNESFCYDGVVKPLCNGMAYDEEYTTCVEGDVPKDFCGKTRIMLDYVDNTSIVLNVVSKNNPNKLEINEVITRTQAAVYNPPKPLDTLQISQLDLAKEYRDALYQNKAAVAFLQLVPTPMNATTQFCYNYNVYEKCDGEEYDPATQKCKDGKIVDKTSTCASDKYDVVLESYTGNKLAMIKKVKACCPAYGGLKEAKNVVDEVTGSESVEGHPFTVGESLSEETAEAMVTCLEEEEGEAAIPVTTVTCVK